MEVHLPTSTSRKLCPSHSNLVSTTEVVAKRALKGERERREEEREERKRERETERETEREWRKLEF